MSMFTNYDAIPDNYIPNNIECQLPPTFISFSEKEPKKEYNIKGDFIGYSWEFGDTLTLNISVNKHIFVEDDSLILTENGEEPYYGNGRIGMRAYNTFNIRSWTCVAIDGDKYVWREDSTFSYPENGTKEVTLMSNGGVIADKIIFSIYDWRRNKIYEKEYDGSDSFSVIIDKELSDSLIRGVYFFSYSLIYGEDYNYSNECAIIVK